MSPCGPNTSPRAPEGVTSRIFFTDQDEIPALSVSEEQNLEDQCVQSIRSKAQEIEELFLQDCQTMGMAVKMLEPRILKAMRKSLQEIREKSLEELQHFITALRAGRQQSDQH